MNKTTSELETELEQIIEWFESSEADIDESEGKYKRGLEIVAELKQRLTDTKNKVTKIKESFEK